MKTYDLNEAAAVAKMHPNTLRKMAVARLVPSTKIGRRWIFPVHLLDQWIESRCHCTEVKSVWPVQLRLVS